ncbi:hypothetical protein F4801DRAFT_379832 [Xylaria longipes]|nr:hypothetical protein F4801DRAFT_379832 [Xylaria longipes]
MYHEWKSLSYMQCLELIRSVVLAPSLFPHRDKSSRWSPSFSPQQPTSGPPAASEPHNRLSHTNRASGGVHNPPIRHQDATTQDCRKHFHPILDVPRAIAALTTLLSLSAKRNTQRPPSGRHSAHSTTHAFSDSNICTQPAYALRYVQSRTASESLAASTTTLAKMSEYLSNYDFDALIGPDDQPFDFTFLDNSDPIGQDEAAGYDYNAAYGFDPGMDFTVDPAFDFDFNASFQPDPSLPGATMTTDQS